MKLTEQQVFCIAAKIINHYAENEKDYQEQIEQYFLIQNCVDYLQKKAQADFTILTKTNWEDTKKDIWKTYKNLEKMNLIEIKKEKTSWENGGRKGKPNFVTHEINFYNLTEKGIKIAKKYGYLGTQERLQHT